jgi:hypothetical protein
MRRSSLGRPVAEREAGHVRAYVVQQDGDRALVELPGIAISQWKEPDLIREADQWLAERIYREADNSCRVALAELAEHMEKGQTRDDLLRYMADSSAVEPSGRYR